MTRHTVRAICQSGNDGDGFLVDIEFIFTPGIPEQGPSYDSGGELACPPEVEFVSAILTDSELLKPSFTQKVLDDWAADWLTSAGYDEACQAVADTDSSREYDRCES